MRRTEFGRCTLFEPPPFYFDAMRPDGTRIARFQVHDGNWHEAECWCYLASVADRTLNPSAWDGTWRTTVP